MHIGTLSSSDTPRVIGRVFGEEEEVVVEEEEEEEVFNDCL